MALAVIRKEFLETARTDVPEFLQYRTFVAKDSAYNTPAVFCIYTLNKMLHWIKNMGGTAAMEIRNKRKRTCSTTSSTEAAASTGATPNRPTEAA